MEKQNNHTKRTQSIILQLNKTGLSYLTHQQFSQAFEYFKQSQKIINNQLIIQPNDIQLNKLAGITYNNLACYYKKTNKPKISLIYLEKALDVEVNKVEDWSATASTHLNICAIHSYMKEHQPAADHAQFAIQMLAKIQQNHTSQLPNKKYTAQQIKSLANLNMLAHYNLAIQLQHLKKYQKSIQQFLRARELAKTMGKKHTGIIIICDQSIARMKQLMNLLKQKLIKLVNKKRQEQQKGHYYFMRKNKRSVMSIKNIQQNKQIQRQRQRQLNSSSLAGKIRQLKVYQQKPHYKTKSILRFKSSPKNKYILGSEYKVNRENNINSSSFSYL